MNTWIEGPPAQEKRGLGCVGKGGLILACFIVFLMIAGTIDLYFGMRTHSAVVNSVVWAKKSHVLAQEPSPVPQFETTEQNINATRRKWKDFEKNTRNQPAHIEPSIEPGADDLTRNQPAFIELTADDLNNLIARNRHLRDKAFVTIEDNRLRIRMSVPVGEYVRDGNYYLNADIVITSEGRQSLDNPRVSGIIINNQSLPSDVLDWKYDGRPLRDYLGQHGAALGDDTIEIRDGKVIIYRRD
jgi:hypothetical protein